MNELKKYTWMGLLGLGAFVLGGCAPSEDADDGADTSNAEVEIAATDDASADVLPLDSKGEGSEPKSDAPFAGGETEAVDTTMRDATEYGDDALLTGLVPDGWSQVGSIEHYNIASLYTKIDGRSELYMAYDVLGLSWISMNNDSNKNNFLDLFIYDMQSPSGSFGIYSVEREEGQEALTVGDEGYKTGSNFYFRKGRFYGYINASTTNEVNDAAGHAVSKGLMNRIETDDRAIVGLDWLPTEGLISDSLQFFKADAMSLEFLTNTMFGNYMMGENKVRAFITKRADDAEAESIFKEFQVYGTDYAEKVDVVSVDGKDVALTDWGGDFYDGVVQIGSTIVGVSNVEGRDLALSSMTQLINSL
ncbi:MAG TPA: hypothetical protein EYN96_04390 [Candidatus Hydrogenedentes bacterium]|nr:hypothetical protein [Candidatus Hydrogenedentota bacterium]